MKQIRKKQWITGAFVLSIATIGLVGSLENVARADNPNYQIQIRIYERATKDSFEMPLVAGVAQIQYSNQLQETSQGFPASGGIVSYSIGSGNSASSLGRLTVLDASQNQLAYCNDGQIAGLVGWAYRHAQSSIPLIIIRTLDNSARTIVQVDSALPDSPSCDGFPEMPVQVSPVHVVPGPPSI